MKKRIGISFTTTNYSNYPNWFTSADLTNDLELVELTFKENNIDVVESCDGFVLTGGVDIHPIMFSGLSQYPNMPNEFQKERDLFEQHIYNYTQQKHKPLLGICRGLQLVNVCEGGKLLQDAGDLGNSIHKAENGDKEHGVSVVQDSLLFQLTGELNGTVNSAHHQLIDPQAIGTNLKVNCWSATADGCIEGIEFEDKTNKAFMLCVQWHPERMKEQENVFTKNIKKGFLEAVRKGQ